ncbi:MAG: GNAT family N-acetyltransferase, partial [Armatimonadota bacterium]
VAARPQASVRLQCELAPTAQAVTGLREEWRGLEEMAGGAHPYTMWEWVEAWYRAYEGQGQVLCVQVREPGGALVGVAPLFAPTRGDGNIHDGELCFASTYGRMWGYYPEFLSRPGRERETTAAVLGYLHRLDRKWSALRLVRVDPDSETLRQLVAQAPLHGLRVYIKPGLQMCVGELPERAADVVSWLRSPGLRRQYRHDSRRLEHDHPQARYRLVTEPSEVALVLEEMRRLNVQQWEHRSRSSNLSDEGFCSCLGRALPNFLASGNLRLEVLEVGDRMIAAQIALLHRGCVHMVQPASDVAFASYSVTHLMQVHTLEEAVAAGADHCDFSTYYPYKAQYVGDIRQTLEVTVLPESVAGTLGLARKLAERSVRLTARGLLRKGRPRCCPECEFE